MLTVSASIGTVTISDVYNGETKLTKNTHYTVSGNKVTLNKEYLDNLAEDDYTIIIKTNQGDGIVALTVVDTTEEA